MSLRKDALEIFDSAVSAVLPAELIESNIKLGPASLTIAGKEFSLEKLGRVILIGAGKASAAMAFECEHILGDLIDDGIVITKDGHSLPLSKCEIMETGHPVPDSRSIRAGEEIIRMVSNLAPNDLVILLLSGGASSLVADISPGAKLEEIQKLFSDLLKSGADISEMNCVRKHLSKIKGGQLATLVSPASLVTIIISDVVGNALDVIGSGPSVPDPTTFQQAIDILEKYQLLASLPTGIREHLEKGVHGIIPETPKEGDPIFKKVHNALIGSNQISLKAGSDAAKELGYEVVIMNDHLVGDAVSIAKELVDATLAYEGPRPACLFWSGESTLRITGEGSGGRCQHTALSALRYMRDTLSYNDDFPTILCAGTDGTDGPTNAAGAIVDKESLIQAELAAISMDDFIAGFDSYHFFELNGGHIITGPTQTNVMDIIIALIP